METSQIKNFAQALRNQLRDGVKQRLLYWGFDEKGEVNERPEAVEGGYMFRGEVFSDETVPERWKQLKRMIDLHSIDYVIEEGAYTWFNRLMAIRILEKNDYIQPQLQYQEGTQLPHLLQNARSGIFPDMKDNERQQVKKQLRENKDNEAFARLLTHFCDTQPLISKVFGKISYSNDYTELLLPQNLLDQEGILDFIVTTKAISDEDFEQVELIGWLYQYYISEKKDQVFKSFKKRKKAGPEELPAATQIFTPEWIVRYMVENTVGRLWLDLHPDSPVQEKMQYLVEPAEENPTAEPIIEDVTDLTLLDPAAGSGHILVVGFEYLMEMYREEGYTARQAIEGILENNLYGLEIDERAAQLARFAVLLKAAKYDQSVLDGDKLPHIHSFPEQTNISTAEVREFLGSEGESYVDEFKDALHILQEGKNFGSTIQLEISEESVAFAQKRVEALQPEAVGNLTVKQLLQKIEPFIYVIKVLRKKYKTVVANPPYLGNRHMNSELKTYLKKHFKSSWRDLFVVFTEVGIKLLNENGLQGIINRHSWMFLKTYSKFREKLLNNTSIKSLIHLGSGAFDEISGEIVSTVTFISKKTKQKNEFGKYYKLTEYRKAKEKKTFFKKNKDQSICKKQSIFQQIPGSPIAYWVDDKVLDVISECNSLEVFTISDGQNVTGNNSRFLKYFWEVEYKKIGHDKKWLPYAKGGGYKKWYGNIINVIDWSSKARKFYNENSVSRIIPEYLWFKEGITWSLIATNNPSFRLLPEFTTFDKGGSSVFFKSEDQLVNILALCNSEISKHFLGIFNPTHHIQVTDVRNIPVKEKLLNDDIISELAKKCIKIVEEDWNENEYSYEFGVNPLLKYHINSLQDTLDNYKSVLKKRVTNLFENETKINQRISHLYDLGDVINCDIDLSSLSIAEDEIDYSKVHNSDNPSIDGHLQFKHDMIICKFLSYVIGVIFGRYKLDKSGFYIASKNESNPLKYNFNDHELSIDDDGLIPLIGSDGPFSDDVVYRMKDFIRIIWGEQSLTENLNYIQKKLGNDLEKFLTDKFWSYHTKLYSKRPIYWLFSSKNGVFKVLAYMHRMDKYTAKKVRQNYLHPYIDYLRNGIDKLEGRDSKSSEESKQLDTYHAKLKECQQYDEVIHKIADKQIDFDLDDGVKHNYELFGDALAKI